MTDGTNTDPGTTGRTRAQEWKALLEVDCDRIVYTGKRGEMFDHIHDLADCAFARAEEVAADVAALTTLMNTRINAQAALIAEIRSARVTPAEARESDPDYAALWSAFCECGHEKALHDLEDCVGRCTMREVCNCISFRPAAPHEPAPTVALDPDDIKTVLRMVEGLKATEAEMQAFKRLAGRVWS